MATKGGYAAAPAQDDNLAEAPKGFAHKVDADSKRVSSPSVGNRRAKARRAT